MTMEIYHPPIRAALYFGKLKRKYFFSTLMKHINFQNTRKYYVHSNEQLLRQKMYQRTVAFAAANAASQLNNNPVF